MTVLQIEHRVRDYEEWKRAFDSDPVGREQGGVRQHRIVRGVDDPNFVAIELEFDDADAAERFREALSRLWDRVGSDLGLENQQIRTVEVMESKQY